MSGPSLNTLWARAFVEELARAGVTDMCLAPGSRSAPLVMAAAAQPGLRLRVHLDERSAAFFALGVGKASGRPAAVVTTSGTAAANLLPAVVEASQSEVPLLLLTADRPPHLRDSDANQAIDQLRLFGVHVRAFIDVSPPVVAGPALRHLRALAARAVAAALGLPAGPVHLNFPFDKPLEPVQDATDVPPGFTDAHPRAFTGREGGKPFVRTTRRRPRLEEDELAALARLLDEASRGVIVAGPSPEPERLGEAVLALSAASGLPVLADPLSGARFRAPGRALVIRAYDLALREPALRAALAPDLVLRVGQSPGSATLLSWLEANPGARHVVVDPGHRWMDHLALASDYLRADAADTLARLAEKVRPRPPEGWGSLWRRAEERTVRVASQHTDNYFFEGSVLSHVAAALPQGSTLFVSSSMPVRDLDAFGAALGKPVRVLGNRGASGIDGVVSSALGASTASAGPTVAVLGDVAFLHDLNGLLATREPDARVIFVVINNDGGGIFHLLPIRDFEPEFTPYFVAPHGLELSHGAALYRLPYVRVKDRPAFDSALAQGLAAGGSSVIEVRSDARANRQRREAVQAAVIQALSEIPEGKVHAE